MDLGNIKSSPRDVELLHPLNDEPTGLIFHLRAPSDPAVKAVERAWQDRKLAPGRRGKNKMTSEDLEVLQFNRIVAQVSGWTWTNPEVQLNGQPEYSEPQLRKWLKEFDWLKAFLTEETEDVKSFLKGPESS